MDVAAARAHVEQAWEHSIVPALERYVAIPALSPAFDPDWAVHGELERAVALAAEWISARRIADLALEVVRLPGRTPLLLLELPGDADDTALLYGHLDKQPAMTGWGEGLGPWTPVRRGERLYGRGAADDGYAVFAAVTALELLRAQRRRHARCVVLIETCEESGSYDLPFYMEHLRARIGRPSLVIGLDSGCGNYEQLWRTTSLRGIAAGALRVQVLEEGVHSGDAGGVVPSSFRIARQLLDRLEDAGSGAIRPACFSAEIPAERIAQAEVAARVLGESVYARFPFAPGVAPTTRDGRELILRRTWRPALEVTGADGLPAPLHAGNVLRPETTLKLSLRVPPTVDAAAATEALRALLCDDAPCGARVEWTPDAPAQGWSAPPSETWLDDALERASQVWFGREAVAMGEGATIPFMAMLGAQFPEAQFLITGVLGPGANAHGPNEFLHLGAAARLTGCVASVLAAHAER
ncbi:MAG: peptidase M20 [Proteobacteria bacterium]|nr:MAG: peptidase M20 [Pseudomonadota bacterium]